MRTSTRMHTCWNILPLKRPGISEKILDIGEQAGLKTGFEMNAAACQNNTFLLDAYSAEGQRSTEQGFVDDARFRSGYCID